MKEQSKMASMISMAMPWTPVLYEIGRLLFWMYESYQDIQSIPGQLKGISQYYVELVACL